MCPWDEHADSLEQQSVRNRVQPRAHSVLRSEFPSLLPTAINKVMHSLPEVEGLITIADWGTVGSEETRNKNNKENGEKFVEESGIKRRCW
jgi:hypothetical protein